MSHTSGNADVVAKKLAAVRENPYAARISTPLADQLLELDETRGDYWSVIDAIDNLEGLRRGSNAKPAEQFRHAPLDRFWHQHLVSARHILRNVGERWGMQGEGNRDLDREIAAIAEEHGNDPDAWQRHLAHRIVIGGYEERAAAHRLTGEWLIFGNYENSNYYCLAVSHPAGID